MKVSRLGPLFLAVGGSGLIAAGATIDPPFAPDSPLPHVVAAVVLSGDVDYLRIARAAELYRQGRVTHLLVTGSGFGGDSASELARQASARGVAPQDLVIEPLSTSTRENLDAASALLRERGWARVALVTSRSHMGRAVRAARRAAPEVEWLPVAVPDAGPPGRVRKTRLQEWIKLAWYGLRGWI